MKKRREIQAHVFTTKRYGQNVFTTPEIKGSEDKLLHRAVTARVREELLPFD
jgi:hypothetical protein